MQKQCTETISDLLGPYARRSEDDLAHWLIPPNTPAALAEVMRYCTSGGKRLRPALVQMTAEAAGGDADDESTRRAAVAVELVHCYSLVHDDLPAMDDDTLRRSHPTAHVRFGEAMAILAGDALLSRAFGVLGEADGARCGALAVELASGAGAAGMIAGQVADMQLCDVPEGLDGLRYIHLHKTASMIRAAARMGAICAQVDEPTLRAVSNYAEALGLAFQIIDDVLDVTGQAETIGKTPGKDAHSEKRTHAAELGLEQAKILADELTGQAMEALQPLGQNAQHLRSLARLLAERAY